MSNICVVLFFMLYHMLCLIVPQNMNTTHYFYIEKDETIFVVLCCLIVAHFVVSNVLYLMLRFFLKGISSLKNEYVARIQHKTTFQSNKSLV